MATNIDNPPWDNLELGTDHDDILIESSLENQAVSSTMASQATHQLDIYTYDLDHRVYDNADFVEAIRSLATRNDRSRIRILVADPDYATRHGHRLIELSRRLTSSIEIRRVHADYASFPECYLIVDKRGVIHRKLASRYEAIVYFNNPALASELSNHFDEVWEHSTPETNFKRLYI